MQAKGGIKSIRQVKGFSTKGHRAPRPKRKGRVYLAAAGGALGVTTIAFTDDLRHAFKAAERSGRVASTLAVCINE